MAPLMPKIALFPSSLLLVHLLLVAPVEAAASDSSGEHVPAEESKAGEVVEAPAADDQTAGEAPGAGAGVTEPPAPLASTRSTDGFDVAVSGYLRSMFTYIDYDESESDFIGRNQGFGLASVRLGVRGSRDGLRFVLSADGAVSMTDQINTADGRLTMRLADAFAAYEVVPGALEVQVGQQKVPFDGETLISTAELPFIRTSVWQRGVRGVEGFNVEGLGIDREIGVTLAGDRIGLGDGELAFSYAVAVTNGSPASGAFNENRALAAYARVEGHYEDIVTAGGAVLHNTRSFGALPDLLDERYLGFAADLAARYAGGWLRLDFVQRVTDYPDVEVEPARTSLGFGASLGFRTPCGIESAYRLAYYDPTFSFSGASPTLAVQLENNELLYHTFGIAWVPPDQPVAVQLNYTHARENPARSVRNDRVELLGRLVF